MRPTGRYARLAADGSICNETALDKIQPPWLEPVAAIMESYKRLYGDNLLSIYLHGSVPAGDAIPHLSDLDSFAVLKQEQELGEIAVEERAQLAKRFPFVNGFDVFGYSEAQIRSHPTNPMLPFYVKVIGLKLYGKDLATEFAPFYPNQSLADLTQHMAPRRIGLAREKLLLHERIGQINWWCRWIMRYLIRLGFSLVMPQKGVYTRDIVLACQAFCECYPTRAVLAQRALVWSDEPGSHKAEILSVVEDLGGWLLQQIP